MSVREIAMNALEDSESGKADQEVRELCMRLIARMAMLTKNPETLLIAGYLQKKHEIDITHEMKPFLAEAERFEKPEKEIKEEDYLMHVSTVKKSVAYLSNEDVSNQLTMSYDAFTADKDYFYNYSELRGLSKAAKGPTGGWKRIEAMNSDIKGLKGVSFVMHNGMLVMRHKGLPNDTPFVAIDKQTLKIADGVGSIKFKHCEDEDAKLQRLDWSDEKLPREE